VITGVHADAGADVRVGLREPRKERKEPVHDDL
jgi:hypothetical protein